jgi:enamine deaminase RidA (YjgF/YER057c/UK114 family)
MSGNWSIQRLLPSAPGRSGGTAYGPLAWTVASAPGKSGDIRRQTAEALELIAENLKRLGSDRTRILSATVYLADIGEKAAMDEIWCAWIGDDPAHWPQRACVQARLAGEVVVEIAVVAARSHPTESENQSKQPAGL